MLVKSSPPEVFLGKDVLAQAFSCECYEISKNTLFTEHLRSTASAFLGLFYVHKVVCQSQYFFFRSDFEKQNQKRLSFI